MEKKIMNKSILFAVLAMIAGVFYREFTKFNGFINERTTLAFMHPHLIIMGTIFFIIILLFNKNYNFINKEKIMKYLNIYSVGLLFTVIMMLVRGITQVLEMSLTVAMDKSISGIAGISHIILGITFILILNEMKKSIN